MDHVTRLYHSAPIPQLADRRQTPAPDQVLLRLTLALVFVWFGLPKLARGLSPAEDLVRATIPWFDPAWFVPALGAVEALIGVCFLCNRLLVVGLFFMAVHMVGATLPLFVLPDVTWKAFPVATLEGQYVLKNAVLVAAAFAVAYGNRTRVVAPPRLPPFTECSRGALRVDPRTDPLGKDRNPSCALEPSSSPSPCSPLRARLPSPTRPTR